MIDAIIEQPEQEKFGKNLEEMMKALKSKGNVDAKVIEKIKAVASCGL